jgi:hypothetical protein
LPEEAAEKIGRIEDLLKANGRRLSDVRRAVSPKEGLNKELASRYPQ